LKEEKNELAFNWERKGNGWFEVAARFRDPKVQEQRGNQRSYSGFAEAKPHTPGLSKTPM